MSVRLLKKVLKEQDQLQLNSRNELEEEDENNESVSPEAGLRSMINPFDLLNEGDNDQDDESEPAQGSETEVSGDTLSEKKEKERTHQPKNAGSSQKSKKKKKKKTRESGSSASGRDETSLDEALESLSLDINSSSRKPLSTEAKSDNAKLQDDSVKKVVPSLLQVDPKYLNVENELRRIFGAKVVRSFEKSNQSGTSRQARGARRGTHHIRKTVLVPPSEHWPRWDGSFSMECLETKNGYHYFRYVHSSSYSQAQRTFQAAQAIHDLNGVASILLHDPYHLDSLITMADYFKFVGEHQMAADAIGKCLYALECAWHPMFTPLQGNCQLKFQHETNKPLFTTLFAHMSNMDRRGCHRSALEVCKLLLSLDDDDPVGALFCIDYFALRAGEYEWLERFSEEYKTDSSLWLFPNFSYSLAICRLYLERVEPYRDAGKDSSRATSMDLMKQALMLHPAVLKKLVAKVPLRDQAFTKIIKNSYFRLDQTKIPSLDHLINIYVERSYLIWRLPHVQKLLKEATELVVETLDQDGSDAKDWACVRREAFPSETNEYSHLMVQDFSDSVQTLPPDNLQNFMVDARMVEAGHIRDQVMNQHGVQGQPPRDVANRNALAVLFESMLPWVHYGDGDGAGAEEVNQVDRHGQDAEDH